MSGLLLVTLLFAADPADTDVLKTFRDEFITITPGEGPFPAEFMMGGMRPNEQPVRRVRFTRPFAIAKYEVPQNLYEAVMGANPSRWKGPRNSVEMVSFHEAEEFCRRVTEKLRAAGLIREDQVVRLPSEAEWEYCARAGTRTEYSFGDDAGELDAYAWYTGNAAGNDPPVGAKKPNPWGLYDVHGYLWEWCTDTAHPNYDGAPTNPSAWIEGGDTARRMLRGGSWKDEAAALRSAARRSALATTRDDAIGLRCVLDTVE